MFDLLSTVFSEVQRVSHRDVIGKQAYDRHTYTALYGAEPEPAAKRRRPIRVVLGLSCLAAASVVLYGLAHLFL
jgi:hypothetical protein